MATGPCVCRCPAVEHRHYREGTECRSCGVDVCSSYRPAGPLPMSAGRRRLLLVGLGVPATLVTLLAVGMFAGDWAVYTVLIVIVVLAIGLVTGPDRGSS